MPTPLVVIRRYPVISYGGYAGHPQSVGGGDRRLLTKAGIESYVKLDRMGSVALMVPEADATAARLALRESPDLFERHFAPPCPSCHTPHPSARPPYEMAVVGVGLLAAVGVVVAGWYIGIAYAIAAVSVVAGAIMYSHLPFWRCHACGCRYGMPDASRGHVVRFPERHE